MTPFRASWPGESDGTLTGSAGMRSRTEAVEALREWCQTPSAMGIAREAQQQHCNTEAESLRKDRSKLAAEVRPASESSAAVALRRATEAAARLDLGASVRAASNAAALQLRVWDSQDAALLAQAWSMNPARSRTESGAGMAEPLIRISACGGTGAGAEHAGAVFIGSGRVSSMGQRRESVSTAVTVNWDTRIRVRARAAAVALCWPQCSAVASERLRRHWQGKQATMPADTAPAPGLWQSTEAEEACLANDRDTAETQRPPAHLEAGANETSMKQTELEEWISRPRR